VWKTGLPVRSAVLKPHAGELVVGWVTTSESSLFVRKRRSSTPAPPIFTYVDWLHKEAKR
ncbi:L-lysine 2-3-aminomutase, partial [Penicillium rubens]